MRFLLPWLIKTFINKQFSNFSGQQSNNSSQEADNQQTTKKDPKTDKLGEYVDYEEINENE